MHRTLHIQLCMCTYVCVGGGHAVGVVVFCKVCGGRLAFVLPYYRTTALPYTRGHGVLHGDRGIACTMHKTRCRSCVVSQSAIDVF